MSGALRVLPLGGLGEIGKNMTVVEYGGTIVVVDTGLMFPTPDQLGIDLVLPDFTYLRERAGDIAAIVLTHAHEDHVGALPYVLREIGPANAPPIYGGPLTVAMVRSKLDEHRLQDADVRDVLPGERFEAGAFTVETIKVSHSIPDSSAVALTCDLGTTLITGDYKFDQTPVDGVPADVARLAELGREGVLSCAATPRTSTGRGSRRPNRPWVRSSSRSSPAARAGSWSRASRRTSTACSRSWMPRPRSGARSRWSAARCART